ncbi:MAG: bifunctional adenosylcobinamide kinase/adenosylcobinamide-phosphate guanylyltransferase [Muribaculum sp.]|nr:bifunctional adenosylcobinamide kinase/adenosylcobinamide-phosphate guanylyltransferase [Muribaculum sp.]
MTVLVIGGSGSGKSAYGEQLVRSLAKDMKNVKNTKSVQTYYLATMQICDCETQRKADRHRRLRSGKGFRTIEQASDLPEALLQMEEWEKGEKGEERKRVVLLECVTNLTANEMFGSGRTETEEETVGRVVRDVLRLREETAHLVIISGNVSEDGAAYTQETMAYIRVLGQINARLAVLADRVVEVVAGIPIMLKDAM